ncbi:MAG: hypothetical protein AAGI08_08200 [Bacteroidota bacterium]
MRPSFYVSMCMLAGLFAWSGCLGDNQPAGSTSAQEARAVPPSPARTTVDDLGTFQGTGILSSGEEGAYMGGEDPISAARLHFDAPELDSLTVETVSQTDSVHTVLISRYGLGAGYPGGQATAHAERYLVTFGLAGGETYVDIPDGIWRVTESGRQVRCAPAAQWSPNPCEF